MKNTHKRSRKGYTIFELLLVITALVGAVMGVALITVLIRFLLR